MKSLLALAAWCCGPAARALVFEPLAADWQCEWREAKGKPVVVRAAVAARWSLGFLAALIGCATRHAVSSDGPMWRHGILVFLALVAVSLVAEVALIDATVPPIYSFDLLVIGALRYANFATFAAAMLPAMFLLRRNPRATAGTSARYVMLGSMLAAGAVIAQPSLENYRPTWDQMERSHQRAVANVRAGRIQYPAAVVPELGLTQEERRARYERFSAAQAGAIAARQVRTPWESLRRSTAPVTVMAFGAMGWALGGLLTPTLRRAAMWWLAAWLVGLIAEGRVSNVLSLPHFRLAWWVLPALTATAALSLMTAARRRRV
jgi:hypothetical protein